MNDPKDILLVKISSGGQVFGHLKPCKFMSSVGCPQSASLPAAVERYNAWKAKLGEPERAELVFPEKAGG